MPPTSLMASKRIQIGIFADSGWGKTRLAGTSPGRVLFLRPPVDHTDSVLAKDKPRCKEWIINDWSAKEEAYEHLRHNRNEWDWVWLDSASGYQDVGLDDIWDTVTTEKPQRKRYGLDKPEYGVNMHRLGMMLRELVTLSNSGAFNFGVTAWVAELQPSEDAERLRKLMPWIQGRNMASKMCGYMNVVGFGDFTSKGTRVLHFMENDRYYAKTDFDDGNRPGSFAANKYRVLNPTMPKIIEMINKSGGIEAAKQKRPQATKRRVRTRR